MATHPAPVASEPDGVVSLAALGDTESVRSILDVICRITGMGFAAVAHVTESRWVACQVRDDIGFGLPAGGELPVKTTLCDTVRGTRKAIVIDEVAKDPLFQNHHTPATYGLQSYIAVPIFLEDGEIFGTLCAIDPKPHRVDTPEIRGMFSLFAQMIGSQIDRLRTNAQNKSLEQRIADVLLEKKVYADVIESSAAAVTALDLNWRILAINRANVDAFERVFGKRPAAGDDFLALFDSLPEAVEQQRAIWSRALQGETFVIVQEFGDAKRERRTYEVRFSPLLDESGKHIGASSTSYDVTERVLAEAQLAAAQEQLHHAQKLEAMGQLTGGVAHDFNNLLTPIVGVLDALKRREVIGERERRLLDGAAQSAERARTLVQRLLAFARRQPLQPTGVDVGALIIGMSELIASTTGTQIRTSVDIDEGLPPAHADPNQLEMALLNLSVNARDAMPDGGELRITAKQEVISQDHYARLPVGSYVRLSVADTGAGMDAATLEHAVEPFFSTKGLGKGTGLGLSMVDGLARQLGGALTISSQQGAGTEVTLWLPVSKTPPATPLLKRQDGPTEKRAGLVLLVEDEEIVRLSVADMLMELGYRSVETSSAEEALARIRAGLKPDLVLTDHIMPGMTGTDFARILAAEHPTLPVLIVSGYSGAAGVASDFTVLTKPFQIEDLGASLTRLTRAAQG